jgi:hypothetical protein
VLAVVLLAVGGYLAWNAFGGSSFTIRGQIVLTDNNLALGTESCSGQGGYNDMRAGTQVTVTDAAGAVIALGAVGAGQRGSDTSGTRCVFPFTVADVPAGHGFYGIEVSHRGRLQYPEAQVRDSSLTLSLGR